LHNGESAAVLDREKAGSPIVELTSEDHSYDGWTVVDCRGAE